MYKYIAELLTPYKCSWPLQSSDPVLLTVPQSFKIKGDHTFKVVTPKLWNSLPQVSLTCSSFQRTPENSFCSFAHCVWPFVLLICMVMSYIFSTKVN